MDNPIAHFVDCKEHHLRLHLEAVAMLAAEFASSFSAQNWARIAGLWHDVGKYSVEFQQRIRAAQGADAHVENKSKIDHSTAGAKHAATTLTGGVGKLIAYIIAGHHSGLPDGISAESCLKSRLEKKTPAIDECPGDILTPGISELTLPFVLDQERAATQISLFVRMVYSALVDADFLDTESFMDPSKSDRRKGAPSLSELMPRFFERISALQHETRPSAVNTRRQEVLQQCLAASSLAPGFFSLTVPTGGGKTLSSMAFALKHAQRYGMRRVIYVIPYTSIIEQNAQVFRGVLGEDAVLEHHSNFEPDEEDYRSRLAGENWDASIIVTTNVQFFESLYANRSGRCRKLHNIAESVVILDEVQTLPAPYLLPSLEVLKELTIQYGVSVVLCSATQPAVQLRDDFSRGLTGVREIVDNPHELASALKRTDVRVLPTVKDSELAEQLTKYRQVLCIVNTRNHARSLHNLLQDHEGTFHLSALMCPAHRTQRLREIREALSDDQLCRVVSTQLVEAGVDIDFPVVYRSLAGIDSIAQAAGRCNREGRMQQGQVFVFSPEEGIPPGHFRQVAQAAESVIRRNSSDILSLTAIKEYFRVYYWTKGDALDEEGILAMLRNGCLKGDFPFKTVAEKFRFIKDYYKPVIIPFDEEAKELIRSIDHMKFPRALSRRLQKFTVTVPPFQWQRLANDGAISLRCEMFPVLNNDGLYDERVGLLVDNPTDRSPESLYL